jgi:hypothetical protein
MRKAPPFVGVAVNKTDCTCDILVPGVAVMETEGGVEVAIIYHFKKK